MKEINRNQNIGLARLMDILKLNNKTSHTMQTFIFLELYM